MATVLAAAAGVLAWSPCADATTPAAIVPTGAPIHPAVDPVGRTVDGSIDVPGQGVRTYVLYVPRALPRHHAVPLLVALHGGLGNGSQFAENSGFDALAEANGFLAVYPNGTPIWSGSNLRVWNGGGCCSVADAQRENVNDVGFVSALITKLEGEFDIDRDRVFATGHSNGAILAERLACQLSTKIDAIGVQSGDLFVDNCPMVRPVAALEIHGTDDQNIPVDGGVGMDSLSRADFPPPEAGLRTIAAHDRCGPTPVTSTDPANRAVTFEAWRGCVGGVAVEWATVAGANHAWMGHPGTLATDLLVGRPYMAFDSSAAIWSFLAAHPRR